MSLQDFLSRNVVPPEANRWLEVLLSHDEGRRLGACLAIDIRANALDAASLTPFLMSLNGDFDDGLAALRAFSAVIQANRDHFVCQSAMKGTPLDTGDRYARVIEIRGFTEFYIAPTYNFFPNAAGVQRTRRMVQRGLRLGKIQQVWRGGMPNIWVTSTAQLDRLAEKCDPDHPGTVFNNALGLALSYGGAPDGRPELLAVLYPPGDAIEAFQPTSLDSPWDSYLHLFVAFGKGDNWGRTCSCNGLAPHCSERVHRAIDGGLTDGFETLYIGVSNAIPRDVGILVQEALNRFASGE